jgi:predicted MFS family arabinose efflux permease
MLLVILLGGQAMASMDASILAIAAPSLRADLHASGAQLQLIVAMYTIVFATAVVTGARLGDVLGRRRAFLLGLASFALASLAGGLAPTATTLIFARALQGAAAAVMTPQVLSIVQVAFEGERRARVLGAYSMILAVGVAAGQLVGGLLVGAHLVAAAWRPALLLNAPIGALLLLGARRGLPEIEAAAPQRLDLAGTAVLSVALLTLVLPLTLGRDHGWPAWVWPCLVGCASALAVFVAVERRVRGRGGHPSFDLGLLRVPGVAPGVIAVLLVMSAYAGLLMSVTLYLQGPLRFAPLHAGLVFAIYATGFATASLTWTRARLTLRSRLPVLGPIVLGVALLAVGLVADGGGWPLGPIAPLLFAGGIGHACAFSPLTNRMMAAVHPVHASDMSGLVLTASLIGQVLGVAAFVGVYLGAAPDGPAHALALTTRAIAAVLILTTACAYVALARPRTRRSGVVHADAAGGGRDDPRRPSAKSSSRRPTFRLAVRRNQRRTDSARG